jgi:hypothetical protein
MFIVKPQMLKLFELTERLNIVYGGMTCFCAAICVYLLNTCGFKKFD